MFWLRILVPSARHDDRRLEPGQRLPLVLVVVDGDDLAGRARVEFLDLALEPQRARRRGVELVRQGDLDQRRLDPEDLGGHAEQVAAGLRVRRRDVELEVAHQGDEEAAGVGAELGRLLPGGRSAGPAPAGPGPCGRPRPPSGSRRSRHSRLTVTASFGGVPGGTALVSITRFCTERTSSCRQSPLAALVSERAEVEVGRHAGIEGRGEPRRLRGVGAALVRAPAPLEPPADEDRLGPRSHRELPDEEVADRGRVVADQVLRAAGRRSAGPPRPRSAPASPRRPPGGIRCWNLGSAPS